MSNTLEEQPHSPEHESEADRVALLEYLKVSRGFDFTGYKRPSLMRRIYTRMQAVGIATCTEYLDYLEVHPDEFEELFNTILINVTGFFRDESAWEAIETVFLPRILEEARSGEPIRIWSAGCASGEEPYTIIMMLAEKLGVDAVRERVKLYATDVDEDALQQARHAIYPVRAVAGVPPHLLAKYFKKTISGYMFNAELRRSVIFGRHNLIVDAPISRIDLLVCRNTLMYFNAEVQNHVLSRFHFALGPSGYLFLGKAEMLFSHSDLFTPVDLKRRIFSKVAKDVLSDHAIHLGQNPLDAEPGASSPLADYLTWKAVFSVTAGAQLVVDRHGYVALINNRAKDQFRLSDRDVGKLLQDLELSYRPVDLRSLIDQAYVELRMIHVKDIPYALGGGLSPEIGYFDVQVAPVIDPNSSLVGAVITFGDVTRYRQLQDELQEANRELETAYEELQSTNEELETTNEELQSTVEELETTNEELQSTNEELETMNEELQSANEELQALNDELRVRGIELTDSNVFMTSILSSLKSSAVVLDSEMQVQVWNSAAEAMWGLRSDEAHGSHFLSLDIGLPVEKLKAPIRAALSGEANHSEEIIDAINRRGTRLQCRVLLSSLHDVQKAIRGVLLLVEPL